jgi:hypothetical protein
MQDQAEERMLSFACVRRAPAITAVCDNEKDTHAFCKGRTQTRTHCSVAVAAAAAVGDEGGSSGQVDEKLDGVVIIDASGVILMANKVRNAAAVQLPKLMSQAHQFSVFMLLEQSQAQPRT